MGKMIFFRRTTTHANLSRNFDPALRELDFPVSLAVEKFRKFAVADRSPTDLEFVDFDLSPAMLVVPAKLVISDILRFIVSFRIVVPDDNSRRAESDDGGLWQWRSVPGIGENRPRWGRKSGWRDGSFTSSTK
jgi:hypothetical protein